MFHAAGQHYVTVICKRETMCELVDGFRGVFSKDAGVLLWIGVYETQHCLARRFVGVGGKLAFETGAAMNAAVIGQEGVDRRLHVGERRG